MRFNYILLPMITLLAATKMAGGQEKLRTHTYVDSDLQTLAISRDGARYAVVLVKKDGVMVYERKDGRVVARLTRDLGHNRALTFSPDGKRVAYSVMSADAKKVPYWAVRVATLDEAGPAIELKGPTVDVDNLAFAPDGKLLAGGQGDGAVFLWDISAKKLVFQSDKHASPTVLTFGPGQRDLASASQDGTFLRWDIKDGKLLQESILRSRALSAGYTADGKLLVCTCDSSGIGIEVWRIGDKKPQRTIQLENLNALGLHAQAISPEGKRVATAYDDSIVISSLSTGKTLATLSHSKDYKIRQLALSGDGAFLLSGAYSVLPPFTAEVIFWGLGPPPKE